MAKLARPPCLEFDLILISARALHTISRAGLVVSLVHAEDVVPRACVSNFCGMLEEAAALSDAHVLWENIQGLGRLCWRLLIWAGSALARLLPSPGAPATPYLAHTQLAQAARAAPAEPLLPGAPPGYEEYLRRRAYNPHIPGEVVFVYREECPGDICNGNATSHTRLALLPGDAAPLRRLRLSCRVVADHHVGPSDLELP